MKKGLIDFLKPGRMFRKEFRRQMRMLIVITLGFTIAFTWRQTVFDISRSILVFITHIKSSSVSSVLTSVFITIWAIILIYLASYYLKEDSKHY